MVCKLFDTYSAFTLGMIYLVHLCFDQMTIYKPRMSRPQNSERYMICKYKRDFDDIEPIIKYFMQCHQNIFNWAKNKQNQIQELDIIELVPQEILQGRKSNVSSFFQKMYKFNTE